MFPSIIPAPLAPRERCPNVATLTELGLAGGLLDLDADGTVVVTAKGREMLKNAPPAVVTLPPLAGVPMC